MKVIHIVTNFDLGGSERVAINIAKAKRNAIEYHIIEVCKGNSQFSKELIQEIIKSNIKPHRSIISNHKLGIIFFPFRLFYLICKLKPQIIHTHAEIADLSVCIFYYLFHIFFPELKYVRTIHSTELWVQWKKIGNWCEQHFFKTNVQNIAISQATKEMYEKDYGNVNIPIIYNGIEIQEETKFNNIDKNKLNVVFAGRLVNLKGTDILIKIIKSLENSNIYNFYIIGDGEGVNEEVVEICKTLKNRPKSEVLSKLAELEGVYVPSVHPAKIIKRTKKLTECIYTPIISGNAFFPNTFILEVERGCANRCGFCLASYLNLPIRFAEYEKIIEAIDLGLSYTNKIALLGAQITAHPRFNDICKYIEKRIDAGENIEMSVSSLRVDSFTPEIVNTLVKAGQKNLTLAIEAGSERLRRVINKNLTENQVHNAIDVAKNCGLHGIKFYGMIGLPTETQEDIEEIINLSKRLKKKYKGFELSFGFSTFVPKANTPFQWFGREDEKSLEAKSKYLKKELHQLGIQASISSAKWDYYQAVLSRGDEKLTDYLIEVYKQGGKLGAFKSATRVIKIDTDYYANKTYPYEQKLPWDFIDTKPGKEFLIKESQRLISQANID